MQITENPYEKLIAWQAAHELTQKVYSISESFPRTEMFGITTQLRRAAYSVSANIAEGRGRSTDKQFRYHLNIAQGSLDETGYFLRLSRDLKLLHPKHYCQAEKLRHRTGFFLHRLNKSLKGASTSSSIRYRP